MGVSNCEPFASSLEGRELLRWAAKAGRGGLCAGNEEHACVCSERFAHALLKASTDPQFLTLIKCSANEQNRTQKKIMPRSHSRFTFAPLPSRPLLTLYFFRHFYFLKCHY